MSKTSMLLSPRSSLAGCIFAAIVRDTRGVTLSNKDRLNHFPASPLLALTFQHVGQTHIVGTAFDFDNLCDTQPLSRISIAGSQEQPVTSWSSGEALAITIGFFPDAWLELTKVAPATLANQMTPIIPAVLLSIFKKCENIDDPMLFWVAFQDALNPLWQVARKEVAFLSTGKQHDIADWAQSLIMRAATSGVGQSVRAIERRLRHWTGQNKQSLSFYSKFEMLHRTVSTQDVSSLAELAHQIGYSDQSHMGRAVRRATGFSTAELNKLVANEESFWCYRLLGERF